MKHSFLKRIVAGVSALAIWVTMFGGISSFADTAHAYWNTGVKQALAKRWYRLYRSPSVFTNEPTWTQRYVPNKKENFNYLFNNILPSRHRTKKQYVNAFGLVAPILYETEQHNIDSLLDFGIIRAKESGSTTQVLYGHSSSIHKSDFNGVLIPMIAHARVGSTFSIYDNLGTISKPLFYEKKYKIIKISENVRPSDTDELNKYLFKNDGNKYTIFVTCMSWRQVGSLKHRRVYIAKQVFDETLEDDTIYNQWKSDPSLITYFNEVDAILNKYLAGKNYDLTPLVKTIENTLYEYSEFFQPHQNKTLLYILHQLKTRY